ncbi:hypothetical protein QPX10_10830 [Corynebacterium pseudodiphtheriticum]|uniref:hypothetical protein n=1 Tax=Corynebacterium pseudodiphtheriticum TaxID=37637 RepID=UPI002542ADF9|nr:hypothetical protein [Corynebacterium pseudodiphtheriticum]MDK4244160.1 hypothetical protein [Corynebacterium pseudodiphtheriticum]
MVHSSQAIASHARDNGTGTNTIIEDIFAGHECSHVVLSHIRPRTLPDPGTGADDLFSAAQRM